MINSQNKCSCKGYKIAGWCLAIGVIAIIFNANTEELTALTALGSLSGFAIFYLAKRANDIAKSNYELARQENESRKYRINEDERKILRDVYEKLSVAKGYVLRDGNVSHETLSLYWTARDQARLELPEVIANYAEGLFEKAREAYNIYYIYLYPEKRDGLAAGKERDKKVDRHQKLISELIEAKPHEIFAPYIRIKP